MLRHQPLTAPDELAVALNGRHAHLGLNVYDWGYTWVCDWVRDER